ncbi:MAG: protein-L-isoaspartate(D-aspartate) O-methyltransferase [Bacteroidia bacterium]|nr:protein-L-isoaspartate(D-aspartate) O-methyltransferase [Bacteroidia bacterium]NNF29974.1 protein-L-isoaspartate(D-aspartate) O-methyltransferase [Flavobacteriaceae bacterium]MBT8276046.1 protein-L-isoaspartate(D-aspartate) O-methyltransferase [Bacteroidia bacterium]NNJ80871.1 protein-L-isoaspartate(D-aspartate) O-methyltransferase [Flavobacteriaceae bacterium]NNK53679.1 protein-L-isoaspartate(D-aspartate) O-methyltransferase [Flavobacteriaceae bacterium]
MAIFLTAFANCQSDYSERRAKMVRGQLESRGIKDKATLEAMRKVPRHMFVPENAKGKAYIDAPLTIGKGQTISQPYIVGYMTEQLQLKPTDKVLEIGTGSGYQAAVLAEIVSEVYSIEIIESLGETAANRLKSLGYDNVEVRIGDGYLGWPEKAPFDAIIITAGIDHVPQPLIDQLAEGGRLIVPEGARRSTRDLMLLRKKKGKIKRKFLIPVVFVEFQRKND